MTRPSVDPKFIIRDESGFKEEFPDWPYEPRYGYWGNLRFHYVDEISPQLIDLKTGSIIDRHVDSRLVHTQIFVCLHGEPTHAYLFRHMIPQFLRYAPKSSVVPEEKRYVRRRVLVPDLIGFGRSDKVTEDSFYTWDMHREFVINFVQKYVVDDLPANNSVVAVIQDWGGLLGLTLPTVFPTLFTHMIVMNTALGLGKSPTKAWEAFRDFIAANPNMKVGPIIHRATPNLSAREVAAYDAPFVLGEKTKAGVRRFPQLVPVRPEMRGVADSFAALGYYMNLPSNHSLAIFVGVGQDDPVIGLPVMQGLSKKAFSAIGYHFHVTQAGHFVQEQAGESIAKKALDAWAGLDLPDDVTYVPPKQQIVISTSKL